MHSPRHIRIPSMVGAILAASLMTVVTALPEAVHARDAGASHCAEKVPHDFKPTLL